MPYPGIFRVTCATPMMGLPHVHVYMARGPEGGLVLFDTAMPYDDSFDRIEHGVAYLGYRMTDIERIYLTHAHPDHFGCAGMLQQASGAPVVCHPLAKRTLEAMANPDPDRWMTRMNIYGRVRLARRRRCRAEGTDDALGVLVMGMPTDMIAIEEGDVMSFAGGEWDIYWTPGHEEGHVVFHRTSDGVMIVGDTVLGKITPHIGWMLEPDRPARTVPRLAREGREAEPDRCSSRDTAGRSTRGPSARGRSRRITHSGCAGASRSSCAAVR